jgi:hypothetical protein
MSGAGLDEDGFIRREGDLARVPAAFAPVIEEAQATIGDAFGPDVLHSAYLPDEGRGSGRPRPTTDVSVLGTLIDDLGQWLAAEYLAIHGPKTPKQE